MSNVISFNVYKNTLRRSSGNDPVSSESGYTEILCQFKEGDDWDAFEGGEISAGFFVNEEDVHPVTANVLNGEARFKIPAGLIGNRNPIYFGVVGSYPDGNNVITIATNVVKLDVIRGVLITSASGDPEEDENIYSQLLETLNEGLTSKADKNNVYTKAEIDNRFELHLSVAFDENGVPVKWNNKTTYTAGDFADSRIVKVFIASNVTQLDGGTFTQTNLTDIYIDNVEGAIRIRPTAYPAGTTVHYKGEFNAVGFIVRAMKYFEENKADKANVYTKSEVDVALAGKAAADHTHSEYLTAQDISGKYEKPSGGIPKTDLSSEVQASLGKADSALQSHQSLANYYNKTEVDGALAGKAAADHTHSEYLTAQDISGKEDKSNKFSTIKRSQVEGEIAGYPSVYAVRKFLQDYYYSKTEIDDTTYTKDEVNTALAGKAAANHTHSEYVTDNEMQEALTNIDVDFDNRFELHLSVAFDENGVPVKWNNKTTYTAGDFTGSRIVKAFIASNVTKLNGGTFSQTNLTDIYIDNVEGAIDIQSSAFPAGTTVHYRGEFNAVGFIVRAMKYFEESKENTSARVTSISSSSTNSQYPTAKAVYDKIRNQMLTPTEVREPYIGAAGETPRYKPGKWFVETGAAPVEGNIYTIKIPAAGTMAAGTMAAGTTAGAYMSVHGTADTDYYPIVLGGTSRLTTQFADGVVITVIYETDKTASVYELESTTKNNSTILYTGNVFRVLNYYDSGNTNTLLRTYALSLNKEFPLIGVATAASTTNATPATHTSSYKDLYGIIPSAAANKATINLSTGKITVPGGIAGNLDGSASSAPWSGVTGKPTTLSGYGITDAYTKAQVDSAIQTAIGGIENGSY